MELVAAATLSFTGWTYNQRKTVEAEKLLEVRQMEISEQNQCQHKWKTIRTKEFAVKGKKGWVDPCWDSYYEDFGMDISAYTEPDQPPAYVQIFTQECQHCGLMNVVEKRVSI
mgnify:CR=1 FL=1